MNNNRLSDIIKIIKNEIKSRGEGFSTDRLCMILSDSIGIALKKQNIDFRIINTLDYGATYEHVFIVAFYKTVEMNYVLIDTAFEQFVKKDGYELKAFEEWPSVILARSEEGWELLDHLCYTGCSVVDNATFNKYLSVFTNKEFSLDLNDLIALDVGEDYSQNKL